MFGQVRYGEARFGLARCGLFKYSKNYLLRFGEVWHRSAGIGKTRFGAVGQGVIGSGVDFLTIKN